MNGGNYLNPTVLGFPTQIADSGYYGTLMNCNSDVSKNPFLYWKFDGGTHGGTGGYIIWEFGPMAFFEANSTGLYWNGVPISGGGGTGSGVLSEDNGDQFFDLSPPVIATPTSTATVPGQYLTMYSASIGGTAAGQEFIAGSDLTWRRDRMFGRVCTYVDDPGLDSSLFARCSLPNQNVVQMQNYDGGGYSAIRWIDNHGNERGAMGFANTSAPLYGGTNYLEDNSGLSGFYFTYNGNIVGGMEAGTQDLVWNSTGSGEVFRVRSATGNVTLAAGIAASTGAYSIYDDGTCLFVGGNFTVDGLGDVSIQGTQVLTNQQPPIANSTGLGDVVAVANAILAMARTHGLIGT